MGKVDIKLCTTDQDVKRFILYGPDDDLLVGLWENEARDLMDDLWNLGIRPEVLRVDQGIMDRVVDLILDYIEELK